MSVSVGPSLFLQKSYHQGWTTELWDELSWHENIIEICLQGRWPHQSPALSPLGSTPHPDGVQGVLDVGSTTEF